MINMQPERDTDISDVKKQTSVGIDGRAIGYFKQQANETGIPYQILINY